MYLRFKKFLVFTLFLAIQYISVSNGNPFILLFILHYTSFTISAFTMACLTIERVIVTFKPLLSIKLKEKKNYFVFCMFGIVIVSICIYVPMSWNGTELYWNPETGNFDLSGSYATWSLTFSMLLAFAIIFPANIALLTKIRKEERFRSIFRYTRCLDALRASAARRHCASEFF